MCAVLSCDAILGLNSANYSTLFTYSVVFTVTILAQMKKRDIKNEINGYMPKVMLLEENAFDRPELPYCPIAGCRTMNDDMMVVVWSVTNGKLWHVMPGHTSDVTC